MNVDKLTILHQRVVLNEPWRSETNETEEYADKEYHD